MRVGRRVPRGFLPVYSCDTKEEAEALVVLSCPRGSGKNGAYYARELAGEGNQNFTNLIAFSDHLAAAEEYMNNKRQEKQRNGR